MAGAGTGSSFGAAGFMVCAMKLAKRSSAARLRSSHLRDKDHSQYPSPAAMPSDKQPYERFMRKV